MRLWHLTDIKTGLKNVRSERKADVDYADPQCSVRPSGEWLALTGEPFNWAWSANLF